MLVEAVVALTSAFLPAMVERKRGAILNVASTAAMQPLPYAAGYSAAKAYVLTFSEAIHQEVSGQGVTVTALAPGPVETEFWDIADWQVGRRALVREGVPGEGFRSGRRPRGRRRARRRAPRRRAGAADARRDAGRPLRAARGQAAGRRARDAQEVSELLPRPLRLLLGATSAGVSDGRLRGAVEGRIVLITGASSGVGEASARRLAAAGATVLLVARRAELLERIAATSAPTAASAFAYPCDLADTDAVGELVSRVLDDHGHVDVVVSNAGLSIRRWISESYGRFHDFERTINVNYLGPVRLLLGLLPSMRERGSGPHRQRLDDRRRLPAAALERLHRLEVGFRGVARGRRAGDPAPTASRPPRSTCSSSARRCSGRSGCGTTSPG